VCEFCKDFLSQVFNPFNTGTFTAKVPGTPAVSKNGIFVHKMTEDDFQTKL